MRFRISGALRSVVLCLIFISCNSDPSHPAGADRIPNFVIGYGGQFSEGGTLTNAIADFDRDGDLDLFVGFRNAANRLYRNDGDHFTDVAPEMGIADNDVTRTAAWGDYDGDGWVDLFVGFVSSERSWNRLYRNAGAGNAFIDVTEKSGVAATGSFRQANWIDFDADGDLDLYVGLRDKPNILFRNENGQFVDVATEFGVADDRRTVGAAWFDFDKDGDLDLCVANMDGDANGLFRNDGDSFKDVAVEAGIAAGGRMLDDASNGTVRPTIVDYDNDGNFDILMANYGPTGLFRNLGDGHFENVAEDLGLAIDARYDTGTWGDYDQDGLLDLYINGTIAGGVSYRDYLFRNTGSDFIDVTPGILLQQNADHGAHWADLDNDGDLDLALTGAAPDGMHYVFENRTPRTSHSRSLTIAISSATGVPIAPGSEVRIFSSESGALLAARLVDTGSGYNAQNVMPIHVGLARPDHVDVEITSLSLGSRDTFRFTNISPTEYRTQWLQLQLNGEVEH